MLTREQLVATMQLLPDKVSVEEVLERIILLQKIDEGREQSNLGKVTSDEDLDTRLGKWSS